MQDQHIETHVLDNGLTLLIEPMTSVQSAAFSLMIPSGSIYDPPGKNGSAGLLNEQLFRGAGDLNSKQLAAALDNLGVQYGSNIGTSHLTFSGATLATSLPQALKVFGKIVREPHLPEDQFEAARMSVIQSLRAVEDEPRQKIFLELRKRCYDLPWGLPTNGSLEEVAQLTSGDSREHYQRCFRPNDSILAVAGNVSVGEIKQVVEEIFGDWELKVAPDFELMPTDRASDHLQHDSEQTQIGIAYESVPYRDPRYYAAWGVVSVLSSGMSSRLFTEVREKRGLCYTVYSTLHSLREEARVLTYAGTTAERAQETLDVTLEEFDKLKDGIEEHELNRCKARAKSSIITQQESTSRRAGTLASNWYHRGQVVPVSEIQEKIDALTVDSLLAYIHEYPARNFTVMTIGPDPLEVPVEIS